MSMVIDLSEIENDREMRDIVKSDSTSRMAGTPQRPGKTRRDRLSRQLSRTT